MDWTLDISPEAKKQLKRLDPAIQKQIDRYLMDLLNEAAHPCQRGKPLTGDLAGLWRYRCGDYRILCDIQHDRLVVLVIHIGHRSTVYG